MICRAATLADARQGAGRRLLTEVATWCRAAYPGAGLYLWVFAQNRQARTFYERHGTTDRGGEDWVRPGGGLVDSRGYAWSHDGLTALLERTR